ncbi:MAG: ABC transporter permease [Elusimicrobia bacterium]|nr:ABC transporter permease [Elusimicrobiota bacterium]
MDPHRKPSFSLPSLARTLHANWFLIGQLSRREIAVRYRGSLMGIFWSFLNPIIMLVMYTFVFGVIFKSKWNVDAARQGRFEYAIGLFAGLIVVGFFNECLARAPTLVLSNPSYVKKVVFPLETLVPIALLSALFHTLASFIVLLAFCFFAHLTINPTAIMAPLVLIPLVFMTAGFSWFLASLGVFLRDMGQIMVFVTNIVMFTSPVFYPTSQLPPIFRKVIVFNPVAVIIEQFRTVIITGNPPDFGVLAIYTAVAVLVCWGGYAWFQKTRHEFADVI